MWSTMQMERMACYSNLTWKNYGKQWIFLLSRDWSRRIVWQKRKRSQLQRGEKHVKGKSNTFLLQTPQPGLFSPPLSTGHTFDKHCHRFICTSCLLLLILCLVRSTTTTPETATEVVHHVCFYPVSLGSFKHLLFDHITLIITFNPKSNLLLYFVTHHFICAHASQTRRWNLSWYHDTQ